jgi:hypothetical protein
MPAPADDIKLPDDLPAGRQPVAAIPSGKLNFEDGSFEELGNVNDEIDTLSQQENPEPLLNVWADLSANPTYGLSAIWEVSGNVQTVRDGQNHLVELVQAADTSIGQFIELDSGSRKIEFDLQVLDAGIDDELQVLIDGQIIHTVRLQDAPAAVRIAIDVSVPSTRFGLVTLRLMGNDQTRGVIRIDNLAVVRESPGDVNSDGLTNAADIDLVYAAIRDGNRDSKYDLNNDNVVDRRDVEALVERILNTFFGDANLDGVFDSSDFVQVFQRGEYEDGVEDNSGWADGDWDGDGEFGTSDLVLAFQKGGYRS